ALNPYTFLYFVAIFANALRKSGVASGFMIASLGAIATIVDLAAYLSLATVLSRFGIWLRQRARRIFVETASAIALAYVIAQGYVKTARDDLHSSFTIWTMIAMLLGILAAFLAVTNDFVKTRSGKSNANRRIWRLVGVWQSAFS